MLTCSLRTVAGSAAGLLAAVFFSTSLVAADRQLFSLESGMNELVYRLSRSVVTVESYATRPGSGVARLGSSGLSGTFVSSGIICDTAGHVLVAASAVVGQDRIVVTFDNRSVAAKLVAVDYLTELALLETPSPVGEPVAYSDRQICAGQLVVAMGNAYGMRATPSLGFCAGARSDGMLQFASRMASSSLGGGVFDLSGRLLGITIGSMGSADEVMLAVPAYQLPSLVRELVLHGDRQAGFAGVSTVDIETLDLPGNRDSSDLTSTVLASAIPLDRGVVVTYVVPSSPAAQAGLRRGDVIVGFARQPVNSAAQLAQWVRQTRPGSTVSLEFIRNSSKADVPILIGRKGLTSAQAEVSGRQVPLEKAPSADSLLRIVDYLKQEVSRLEGRLEHLR